MVLNIVLYTHTDYKDVWPPFFGQIKKFIPDYKLHVLVNQYDEDIPIECSVILYTDKDKYTQRLKASISQINCEYFLFIHEDMYLYASPDMIIINKYLNYIKNNLADSIKLIYVSGSDTKTSFDNNLVQNEYSKFSIQPTLISKKILLRKLNSLPPLDIYSFEAMITDSRKDFLCSLGNQFKRGIAHYDSKVFPYVATAVVKGKWNFSEYPELENILSEYNINPMIRGIR